MLGDSLMAGCYVETHFADPCRELHEITLTPNLVKAEKKN